MKNNILKLLMMMFVFGLTSGAFAQSKLSEEQKEELLEKYESYRTELNLSEAQQEKVKEINSTYFEGLASLQASGGSKLSKLKTFRTLSDRRDKEMGQVLDKEQYKRYKEMQKEMRSELKSRRKQ